MPTQKRLPLYLISIYASDSQRSGGQNPVEPAQEQDTGQGEAGQHSNQILQHETGVQLELGSTPLALENHQTIRPSL
jgi:hypothetical protein